VTAAENRQKALKEGDDQQKDKREKQVVFTPLFVAKSEISLKEMNHRNIPRSDLCIFLSGNHRYQQLLWVSPEILIMFAFCVIFDFHFRRTINFMAAT
jgi:hypothetical protein